MKNKRIINYNLSNPELYYLAGIIDSSSSFYLNQEQYQSRWVGGFVIQNTNHNFIKIIKDLLFLGDSHLHTINLTRSGHNQRQLKAIRIFGPILDEILPKLVDKLKVKKEHAEIIIKFRETVSSSHNQHNPITNELNKLRISLKERLKYLNSNEYKNNISSPLSPSSLR